MALHKPANIRYEHGDVGGIATRRPSFTKRTVNLATVGFVERRLTSRVPQVHRAHFRDVVAPGEHVENAVEDGRIIALEKKSSDSFPVFPETTT